VIIVHDSSCNCSSFVACTVVAQQYWLNLQCSGLSARCRLDCSYHKPEIRHVILLATADVVQVAAAKAAAVAAAVVAARGVLSTSATI
jgi:hypothetical protein